MIDIARLRSVTHIVTHANCSDGLASAMILRDAIPIAHVHFAKHGVNSELFDEDGRVPVLPYMLFCDICPPVARADEFLEAGAIVLDHHKGLEDVVKKFVAAGRGVFADEQKDPGVSGALLAFRHVWQPLDRSLSRSPPEVVCEFATLVGVRDTWRTKDPAFQTARIVHQTLMFYPRSYFMKQHAPLLTDAEFQVGRACIEKHDDCVKQAAASAYRAKVAGISLAVINDNGYSTSRLTSDVAEVLEAEGVQLVAGFWYEGLDLCVSLRSKCDVNVASIAKSVGGGGHSQAAGYRRGGNDTLTHDPIITVIADILENLGK